MKRLLLLVAACACAASARPLDSFPGISCDADTDCFYVPASVGTDTVPALLVLHCNGALPIDLDTLRGVGDSLGWVMASCHGTRNHRDLMLNDADISGTLDKLVRDCPVDRERVFVFGFSGQGVQALATLYLHPDRVRGVVSVCGHRGANELADRDALQGRLAYLVTREEDWNRGENEQMYAELNSNGMVAELLVTPGEHGPGSWLELLAACRWLEARSSD